MKQSALAVAIIVACLPLAQSRGLLPQKTENLLMDDPVPVPEHFFHQKLDHFNPADNRFWQQRYYINETFYQPGGPMFLFIGDEDELQEIYARTGDWMVYAEKYHAMCFAVEHRYYGKSRPTADLSTANLQYLTIDQALEDLAMFITVQNKQPDVAKAKWIVFGGSIAGMMSAWMRYKFPHLVDGAVAHSATVGMPVVDTDSNRGQPLERLAYYSAFLAANYTYLNGSCLPATFNSIIADGKYMDYDDATNKVIPSSRAWNYQFCIQLGDYIVTVPGTKPFGKAVSEDYYIKICQGYFGSTFDKALVERGNQDLVMNYAGRAIRATNVVYTQGGLDPFRKLGLTKDDIPGSHVIVIPDVGHVAAMLSPSPLDSAEMTRARTQIQRFIGQWISAHGHGTIIG